MRGTRYIDAGVDLRKYDALMKTIRSHLSGFGLSKALFGGSMELRDGNKILVATVDGVGTKTKVAALVRKYGVIGRDIVAHCVNDLLAMGAKPFAFLDYLAFDKLDIKVARAILTGMVSSCRKHGIMLLGGETAEMPGVYRKGEFDVVGFMIGETSRSRLIDGSKISSGDIIIGLPSNGLHTNGYSLARKVLLDRYHMELDKPPEGWKEPLSRALLRPHKSYFAEVYPLVRNRLISGIAHITGGGIAANLGRILPGDCDAVVVKGLWHIPKIFDLIQACGVREEEMFRVFNMGLGMLLIVPNKNLPRVMTSLSSARIVGEVVKGRGQVSFQ